jgi:hypothetical protein
MPTNCTFFATTAAPPMARTKFYFLLAFVGRGDILLAVNFGSMVGLPE